MTCVFSMRAQHVALNVVSQLPPHQHGPAGYSQSMPWCETHNHQADTHTQCAVGRLEARIAALEKIIEPWIKHDV